MPLKGDISLEKSLVLTVKEKERVCRNLAGRVQMLWGIQRYTPFKLLKAQRHLPTVRSKAACSNLYLRLTQYLQNGWHGP